MKILNYLILLLFSFFSAPQFAKSSIKQDLRKMPAKAGYESYGKKIMIASQNPGATAAGLEIAKMGGNLFDVATAIAFAIAVERPQSTGLGGGGFSLLHSAEANYSVAVDYREQAPLSAKEKMFQDKNGNVVKGLSKNGILAAGVPGLVAGTLKIHAQFGKLPRAKILAPAIRLAKKGFKVYPHLHHAMESRAEVLKQYPASRKLFLDKQGKAWKVGTVFRQPVLARTLERIARKGVDGFYKGPVAEKIAEESKRLGGMIGLKDLASYAVKFRTPLKGTFNGYTIETMPPASSGGVHILQILNMLEGTGIGSLGAGSPRTIHMTAAATQIAFADRYKYLGDTDFVAVPIGALIDKDYAKRRFKEVDLEKATPSSQVIPGRGLIEVKSESTDTTSFAVMDHKGNAIVSIQSINGLLGSGVVVPGAGFVLNNHMNDFDAKPGEANMWGVKGAGKNRIQPKKRPLSSMTPTLLFKKGKPVLAVGTPAGSRIISCIAETILNYTEHHMTLFDSVAATRYHHQWSPDKLFHAMPFFTNDQVSALEKMGYKTSKIEGQSWTCKVGAVAREGSKLHGVCDTRDTGSCRGY